MIKETGMFAEEQEEFKMEKCYECNPKHEDWDLCKKHLNQLKKEVMLDLQ